MLSSTVPGLKASWRFSVGGLRRYASSLSHITDDGKFPKMVDVSSKIVTPRSATAKATIHLPLEVTEELFEKGDIHTKKGPVFSTAIIAGTMAAKNTSSIIPFCHPLPLSSCSISVERQKHFVEVMCNVKTEAKTGVEMEALTGATVASLTIYDMLKAISHNIVIKEVKLLAKTGGKSDISST